MSLVHFKFLLRCLRFNNLYTREERKVYHKFAVAETWDILLINLRRAYISDDCIIVDKQLVGYRGRIPGRTHIPSKLRKYGLKMFWAYECSSEYAIHGISYGGKKGDQVHSNLAQDIVMRLLELCLGTSRDVCTDNN